MTHPHALSVIVLDAQRRESLAVIRSLSRAGYHVIVARLGQPGQGEHSRFCREVWTLPRLSEATSDAVWDALSTQLARRSDVRWVFPVGDDEIHFCQRYEYERPASVRSIAASREVTDACLNKEYLFATAQDAGVSVERFKEVDSGTQLREALRVIGLPCVVKPQTGMNSLAGKKAIILQTADDVVACEREYAGLNIPLIVQSFARGARHNVYFLADRGRLLTARQVRILRTDRLDGTGYAVDGVSVPLRAELREDCERLLRRLDYHGAGCAQFLVDDRTGTHTFLEINARLGANCAIACACGFDVPRLFLELLEHGADAITLPADQYPSRRYAWTLGDVHGLTDAWRSGDIGWRQAAAWWCRLAWTALRADLHISRQWSDPGPTVFLLRPKSSSLVVRKAKSLDSTRPRSSVPATAASELQEACHVEA